jgi:cell division protein FtsB
MLPILRRAFWLFGAAILLLVLFLPSYSKLQELRDKNLELEARIKKLNVENVILGQELELIEKDPVYQERIVREKMGVVRKGEIPVRVVPAEKR